VNHPNPPGGEWQRSRPNRSWTHDTAPLVRCNRCGLIYRKGTLGALAYSSEQGDADACEPCYVELRTQLLKAVVPPYLEWDWILKQLGAPPEMLVSTRTWELAFRRTPAAEGTP
jgi:hypothetical protein